jgi:hypothetical protein
MIGKELFVKTMHGSKSPIIVDIRHPTIRIYEEFYKNNPDPQPGLDMYEWQAADRLGDVFLCSYGAFPADIVGAPPMMIMVRNAQTVLAQHGRDEVRARPADDARQCCRRPRPV